MLERKSQLWAWAAAASVMAVVLWGAFPASAATYNGTVGKPLSIDATKVPFIKMAPTAGYYWDWFADGRPDAFTTHAVAEHTWYSAFSGNVRVGVLDTNSQLDWGLISVEIKGPDNIMTVTLASGGDLHIQGPQGRHVGPAAQGGQLEQQIPDSSLAVFDAKGGSVPFEGRALIDGGSQIAAFPLYMAGTYQVRVVGTSGGPFELVMCGIQDGKTVVQRTFAGDICPGEVMLLDVTADCPAGALQATCGAPVYCPGIVVEPAEINLVVQPGNVYTVPLTVREAFGRAPLKAVHLACCDITHSVNWVPGSDVSFTPNDFDMKDGGQTIVAVISVPQSFWGLGKGTITVECAGGGQQTIGLTLRTPGSNPPHCVGIGPVTGVVGEPVTFDASGCYDRDGRITGYHWEWGDGTTGFSSWPVASHTYTTPFTGQARLVVFDDSDQCADTYVDVTITDP
ncbi:MAG: PKD domain-containing protein [Phycisphaerae bacterium]|nr:PKD domain-containing protein [Phycisphaerae bacterium]